MTTREIDAVAEEVAPLDSITLVEWADGWEIQESDYGSILAFHHHHDGSRVAYVRTDAFGTCDAQCSGCGVTHTWHTTEGVSHP